MDSVPEWAKRARAKWQHTGRERPPFAIEPGEGQESVWDYPRPPRLEPDEREITVRAGGTEIARTRRSLRLLETGSPPTFYLPFDDVRRDLLEKTERRTMCEWKGQATYWSVVLPEDRFDEAAWSYPEPFPGFDEIRDHLAFYAARVECYIDGERVEPQPGGYYGGWVTKEIVGPFKN